MQIYSNKVFENPIEIVDVRGDLEAGIRRVEELRKKYFLLGYITYEAILTENGIEIFRNFLNI